VDISLLKGQHCRNIYLASPYYKIRGRESDMDSTVQWK
jgi:hypothetical protein